jgi:hypothetical protein
MKNLAAKVTLAAGRPSLQSIAHWRASATTTATARINFNFFFASHQWLDWPKSLAG